MANTWDQIKGCKSWKKVNPAVISKRLERMAKTGVSSCRKITGIKNKI